MQKRREKLRRGKRKGERDVGERTEIKSTKGG